MTPASLSILFRPRPAARRCITRILRDLPGVQTPDDGFWRVPFHPDHAGGFCHLWRIVARCPDTLLLADDRVQDRPHANAILEWISCLACRTCAGPVGCRLAAGIPGWGCKCLRSVQVLGHMPRGGGPPWWEVGPFQDGIQYIDKADILDALEAEVQARCLKLCPHFARARVEAAVEALPGQIDPRHTDAWIYRGSDDPAQADYFVGVMPEPHSVVWL